MPMTILSSFLHYHVAALANAGSEKKRPRYCCHTGAGGSSHDAQNSRGTEEKYIITIRRNFVALSYRHRIVRYGTRSSIVE
jgi:hypothetical protein